MKRDAPIPARRRWANASLLGTAVLVYETAHSLNARASDSAPLPGKSSSTMLPAAHNWDALLSRSAAALKPVVVLWGTPGCPWCTALRQDVMIHLWRDAARRNLEVIEFNLMDTTPLLEHKELSAAQLAQRFAIRVSPTVSFHGTQGELAERLVGYPSRDFYLSYFEQRLEVARGKLRRL